MSEFQSHGNLNSFHRWSIDVTDVLTATAATDICSATFRIRERKGRRYRAQKMRRRSSEKRSDGWGAAAGCLISVEIR